MPYHLLVRTAARATGRLGWIRGAVGAALGVLIAALISRQLLGADGPLWLAAPIGASAVLLFVLPASPLAQPWAVVGGNLLSALIGLAAGTLVQAPPLAVALAAGAAIAAMSAARCLHPPGGACAIVGALGHADWPGLLQPLALNLALLLAFAWFYNNLTGHRWPHHAPTAKPLPSEHPIAAYEPADLDRVLEDWPEVLDVSRQDLDALFRAVERRAQKRRSDSAPTRKKKRVLARLRR